MASPKIAPAFSTHMDVGSARRCREQRRAGVPTIHGIAENCSCIIGVPTIHGHKNAGAEPALWVADGYVNA